MSSFYSLYIKITPSPERIIVVANGGRRTNFLGLFCSAFVRLQWILSGCLVAAWAGWFHFRVGLSTAVEVVEQHKRGRSWVAWVRLGTTFVSLGTWISVLSPLETPYAPTIHVWTAQPLWVKMRKTPWSVTCMHAIAHLLRYRHQNRSTFWKCPSESFIQHVQRLV